MTSVKIMIAAAKAMIENLAPADLAAELAHPDVLLVDVRELGETEAGVIPGAVLVPRGMLEFHTEHGTRRYIEGFEPRRRVIVYSGAGSRSVLAVRSLHELGYHDVAHLEGGFEAWVQEGRSVTAPRQADAHSRSAIRGATALPLPVSGRYEQLHTTRSMKPATSAGYVVDSR